MENSQTGGKTWGIPFQRSTIVLYWNKEAFKEAGLDPEQAAGDLEGDGRVRAEAHQARRIGQRHAVGRADSVVRVSRTGCSRGSTTPNGANLMNEAGTETYYDKPEVIEALQYWVDLVSKHKVHPRRHRRVGHDAEGLLREARSR